jgi:probable rRNA maturation factor
MEPGEQRSARARLHIVVSDAHGRAIEHGLCRWLSRVAPARTRGTVSIALVSDQRVRALNRRFRGIDRPTDVLSFPAVNRPQRAQSSQRSVPQKAPASSVGSAAKFLGDIVIARGVARRQARELGHPESTELKVLALHGLLHLLGYDHERDNGAMARLERRLRRRGGLREGLIERR